MIYQIDTHFMGKYEKTYYASSFQEGYEMFKKLGKKLIRTNGMIMSKMYERKEGEVRHGVYYIGKDIKASSPQILMKPYHQSQEVKISTSLEALEDLHDFILRKESLECIYGVNDLRFHYGDKYKININSGYKLKK